jgi:hypothetical protein
VPVVVGISYLLMARWLRSWEIALIAGAVSCGVGIERSRHYSGIAGGIAGGVLSAVCWMAFHYFHDIDFEDEGLGLVGSLLMVAVPLGVITGAILGSAVWALYDGIPRTMAWTISGIRSGLSSTQIPRQGM